MNANVTQLTIKADKRFLSFHPVNKEMEKREENTGKLYHSSPRWLTLFNGAESDHAIECLLGKASFYPYFNDGNHHIMFASDGIREHCTSERPPEDEYWFTFPGAELVPYIRQALWRAQYMPKNKYNQDTGKAVVVVPPDVLISWRLKYGPKYEWNMADAWRDSPGVADKVKQDLYNYPELQNNLDNLIRIAKNTSDGKPSIIYLSFDRTPVLGDDTPTSYLFNIVSGRTGKSTMHGGIIAHPERDGDTITGYCYSIHT